MADSIRVAFCYIDILSVGVFDDFPKISDHFLKISEDFPRTPRLVCKEAFFNVTCCFIQTKKLKTRIALSMPKWCDKIQFDGNYWRLIP